MMSRPALVAILARKPWARLRFRLLGWNVLFIEETAVIRIDPFGHKHSRERLPRRRVTVKEKAPWRARLAMWITSGVGYRLYPPQPPDRGSHWQSLSGKSV